MILDYFNIESIAHFNDGGFYFEYTWKGRLYLLFFLAIFILEFFASFAGLSRKSVESEKRKRLSVFAILVCASIPLAYVISVNFLGLDKTVIGIGEALRGEYWRTNFPNWSNFLRGDWPLSFEYFIFTISFAVTIILAYGKAGLKAFSIALALIAGMSTVYIIDTIYPYGVLRPLQMMALPTAACATALLEIFGYQASLLYSSGPQSSPIIRVYSNNYPLSAGVNWPCAGVQSLFLYTIIILLLFQKSGISSFRKMIYFIIGAIGTYLANVLRIFSFFIILLNQGSAAAQVFHSVYGELYFVGWTFLYISLIICIERFNLVEKSKQMMTKILLLWEKWRRSGKTR